MASQHEEFFGTLLYSLRARSIRSICMLPYTILGMFHLLPKVDPSSVFVCINAVL